MAQKYDTELGHRYGRPDMERIGLFAEMDYMNGKGYVSPFGGGVRKEPTKGRQLFPGGSKSKCGNQDGYFQEEFQRLFENEKYSELYRILLQEDLKAMKKNISKSPFVAPGETKKHSTPGDYYGTFEKVEAFSPILKKRPPYKKEPPNLLSNPAKKGGPGYVDITLSKYPEHSVDFYDASRLKQAKEYEIYKKGFKAGPFYPGRCPQPYFDPNPFLDENPGPTYVRPKEKSFKSKGGYWYPSSPAKKDGGCKAGCFDKWPEHSADKYLSEAEIMRKKYRVNKVFYPQAWGKSMQTCSVVNQKVDICVNQKNFRTYEPITFPNL
ncbi:UPF0602 protein [Blattella germanica]|nr:UPF0602 protein [Blattella germanica]